MAATRSCTEPKRQQSTASKLSIVPLLGLNARVDIDATEAKHFYLTRRTETTGDRVRGHRTVTYREGEVVGRNASEIGSENKGRAMLEKMGWTKGTALGLETNRGILVPIEHVVKKTKAGLGDA